MITLGTYFPRPFPPLPRPDIVDYSTSGVLSDETVIVVGGGSGKSVKSATSLLIGVFICRHPTRDLIIAFGPTGSVFTHVVNLSTDHLQQSHCALGWVQIS
jgi:hypothetical protein